MSACVLQPKLCFQTFEHHCRYWRWRSHWRPCADMWCPQGWELMVPCSGSSSAESALDAGRALTLLKWGCFGAFILVFFCRVTCKYDQVVSIYDLYNFNKGSLLPPAMRHSSRPCYCWEAAPCLFSCRNKPAGG